MTMQEYAKTVLDRDRLRREGSGFMGWNLLPTWAKLAVWLEITAVSAFYARNLVGL